jgi:hypothetical protein
VKTPVKRSAKREPKFPTLEIQYTRCTSKGAPRYRVIRKDSGRRDWTWANISHEVVTDLLIWFIGQDHEPITKSDSWWTHPAHAPKPQPKKAAGRKRGTA